MSEKNIEQNPQQPVPVQQPLVLDTKIEFLNQRFCFYDILKASAITKHYIAEDLENDPSANPSNGFFYVKQSLYTHKGEYQYALKYYQKLLKYCKMPFAKTDIIRLHQIHNFDLEEQNYYEVVLIFDLGEPDRIDVDNIESQHITKFLKNVCLLLQDIKKYDQIYHGNIYIKNIVLVNNELKLSGFKPIYLDNPAYQTWKVQLAKHYNHFRSDLYLIGLIWLRFLGANVEAATNIKFDLNTVKKNINNLLESLPEEKKMNIVLRLLDLDNHPDLTLDDVILEFDEFYILENIRSVEEEKKRLAQSGLINHEGEHNPDFAFDDMRNSVTDERFDSITGAPLKKSASKETNPFMRPYRDSERDLHALKGIENQDHHLSESKHNQDFLKIDGDFTLQDDNSIAPARLSKDELIAIQDVKRDHSKSMFENMEGPDKYGKYENNPAPNKTNSEKRLGVEAFEEEKTSMRKLRSTDVLFADSKKEIPPTESRTSHKAKDDEKSPIISKESFSKKRSVKEHQESVNVSNPKPSVKNSAQKAPSNKPTTPPKKSVKVSTPEPNKKISYFSKNVKNNQPKVYEIDEPKPSSSQILKEKRAQLQGLKEDVELTSEQRIKIQKAVEKELAKRSQIDYEKQLKQKDEWDQRAHETKIQVNNIKAKLDKLTQEKMLKKKEGLQNELKRKREENDRLYSQDYEQYMKEVKLKERHRKNRDASVEKNKTFLHGGLDNLANTVDKDLLDLPKKDAAEGMPIKKNQKSLFDLINKKAERDFKHSTFDQREVLFAYNRELENKQVPFKKLTQNLEKYQKGNIKKPTSTLETLFKTLELDKSKNNNDSNLLHSHDKKSKDESNKNQKGKHVYEEIIGHGLEPRRTSPSFGAAPIEKKKSAHLDEGRSSLNNSQERKVSNNVNEFNDRPKSPKPSVTEVRKSRPSSPNNQGELNDDKKSVVSKLPNKRHETQVRNEFLDTILSKPEFKNLDPNVLENKVYVKTMDEVKNLTNANKNEEAIALLLAAKDKFTNNRKIEIIKMIGALYQKLGQSDKTKQILLEALEYMLPKNEIENKEEIFKSIVLNLVLISIENKDYQEAVSLLKNQVFNDKEKLPNNYYNLLGECLLQLKHHKEALAAFEQQLSIWLEKQISLEMVGPLFNVINKIILCHNALNDQISIAKFYTRMMGVLSNIKHVNISLQLHENDFDNLLEHLTLNFLQFAYDRQNYNLMNYIMNDVTGKNILNYTDNMNEEERVTFCEYFVHFCNYLKKLSNFGGFKDNYIRYLNYAKGIIKNCDLNTKNLKTNLVILFNRGIYNLQEQNYEKAQKLFDKCLEVYYAFFNEPDRDLYAILYSIGHNLYKQGKFSNSIYFFNKMLDLNCQDELLKEKATKYLSKVYYRISDFAKCKEITSGFVSKYFEGKSIINYYRYLSLYYLCLHKLKSDEFNFYLEKLQEEVNLNKNVEATNYLLVYKSLNNIMKNFHNYKENEKFVGLLQDLVVEKGSDKQAKAVKLANLLSLMHQKFVVEKGEDKGQATIPIINALRDRWLTIAENSEMAKDFLINFMIMLINKLPLYNERSKNHQFRQNLLDEIRNAVDKNSMNAYIAELFNALPNDESSKVDDQKTAQITQNNSPNVFASPPPDKEVKKVTSEQVLLKSTPERKDCLCADEFKDNIEISELIERFLKQIKNMLFLDVTEDVEVYYNRFEAALREKGINNDKYSYIRKLIQYHLQRKKYLKLDRLKFTKLLDELVEANNLCIHDFKLIVVILESFKEIEYLQLFVVYLDTYHPNLASLIFQKVFLEVFEHKYSKIVSDLYRKINSFRFYNLEVFPLMHYLESENFISIEKELKFKIFTRLRYDVLNEERMSKIFAKYIDINDLHMFYIKYPTYSAIVNAVKQENMSPLANIRNYYNSLSSAVIKYQIEEIHSRYFVYDFLLLIHLLKFNEHEDLTEPIFQILAFIEDRLPQSLFYHFSIICSAIGNIFFKYRLNTASLKIKTSALDLLDRITDADTEAPAYWVKEDPETHLSQILTFIVANKIELNDLPEAKIFLEKLDQINNEYALNELTKLLLKAVYFYHADQPKKGKKAVKAADQLFAKMNLKDVLLDIYKAAMDKIKLLVALKTDSPEEVQNKVRASEGSIKHLYRPII